MLLQSQNNELHLLPALPKAWRSGSVKGLVGRGGFVVDMTWADHQLKSAAILARNDGDCVVRTAAPVTIKALKLRSEKSTIGYTLRPAIIIAKRRGRFLNGCRPLRIK